VTVGRFVTINGGATGPAVHVPDPGVPLETLVIDPRDVWRTQPSVRKVVDFIARQLSSTPIHLYQRGDDDGRTRVRTGPVADLLRKPAPYTTPYRFWHTIHVDGLLWDRWCFVVLDADGDAPAQLFRIPPARFRVKTDEHNVPERIDVWTKRGERYELDPAVCVFDHGYASSWGHPVAPIDAISDVLHEADEARKYRRELLRNGARVSAVIERPLDAGKWDDATWNRFRAQFASYRAGGGDAGGTPILEDGMKLAKVDAFSPQTLETLEARKLTDAEVAAFWHIAPELVGAREGTFANLDAFRQMLYSISLGPGYVAWEQALDVMLLDVVGREDGQYIEAHVDAKLRGSFIEQAQAMQSSIGAPWLTRNEGRKMRNLPPVEGGDELITPLNVLIGGLASPQDTARTPVGGGGGAAADIAAAAATDAAGRTADDIAKLVNAAGVLIRSGFDPESALLAMGLDPIAHLGLLPVTVQKPVEPENVDQELVDQVSKAGASPGKARGRVKATRPDDLGDRDTETDAFVERVRLVWRGIAEDIEAALDDDTKALPDLAALYDSTAVAGVLEPIVRAHMQRLAEVGAWEVLAEWNPESDGWGPEMVEAWIARAAATDAAAWARGMQAGIGRAATREDPETALRSFLTSDALATVLAGAFALEALGFGAHDAARKSGLGVKTWRVTSSNPRVSHGAQDGQTVRIDDIFANGLRWPGDHFGDAGETAGCTCRLDYGRGDA